MLIVSFALVLFGGPGMAINVGVQYNNGGFLPDIILLTQCYYHRETRLNVMNRFSLCSLEPMIPCKRFDNSPFLT